MMPAAKTGLQACTAWLFSCMRKASVAFCHVIKEGCLSVLVVLQTTTMSILCTGMSLSHQVSIVHLQRQDCPSADKGSAKVMRSQRFGLEGSPSCSCAYIGFHRPPVEELAEQSIRDAGRMPCKMLHSSAGKSGMSRVAMVQIQCCLICLGGQLHYARAVRES